MTLKEHIATRLKNSCELYCQDLEAMPAEMLTLRPGGTARSAFDFTYEIVYVNRRVIARLKGESLEPFDPRDWMMAPPEYCDKSLAIKEMKDTTEEMSLLWTALSDDQIISPLPTPNEAFKPLDMLNLIATHIMYHDAQLNYIQSLSGDKEMHWDLG